MNKLKHDVTTRNKGNFFKVGKEVMDDKDLKGIEKLIFIELLRWEDRCYASISDLSESSGFSKSSVKRAICWLVKNSYIEKYNIDGIGNIYRTLNGYHFRDKANLKGIVSGKAKRNVFKWINNRIKKNVVEEVVENENGDQKIEDLFNKINLNRLRGVHADTG